MMKKEMLLPDHLSVGEPPPPPAPEIVRFEPLLEEVRGMVRDLREEDPVASSYRKWAAKLYKRAGFKYAFRSVKKLEETNLGVDLGYVLASAIAADVEIVLGRRPRVLRGGIEGIARDLFRELRMLAARDPSVDPSAVESLRSHYEQVVGNRVRTF